ncbi:QacE family quaternary ammonium compound efflux SMR transporter [Virgibacillus phasianinus]|uniref:QacE family quaternary ammonium compound efflux SMR transporter n=1 Tax=Virgibacillus phasianinus TaxID=2017483 RepID=A0A220U3W5_9BACI|nr:multidrug efflux SMR transporter [Virgibacillus phasianinus]ASK62797.1 QacE family quaternary ammonium compound efflux SMR transporter [Virgibacillus phasianinus]
MAWIFLVMAGFGEVVGVIGINKVNQNKNISSLLILFSGFLISFVFLSIAMETIRMSTAYAVWTGIGTVGSALIGILIYNESADWRRIVFIAMILSAAIGLKLIS